MRHGIKQSLGCYFCNDVVAPIDSLTDRTLDQQCTVTRPGLAGVASGVAVEMLASLLNHPDRYSLNIAANIRARAVAGEEGVLGIVPHQIRGSLGTFSNLILKGAAYDKCTACSVAILEAYAELGNEFLLKGLSDPAYLEKVAGLEKMKQEVGEMDDIVNWDDEEDEGF